MSQKTETTRPTLEEAMERISGIVTAMEEGDMPLEKLIDSYEEGIALVKMCQEKLDGAEKRIKLITRDAAGGAALVDFAEANGEEP